MYLLLWLVQEYPPICTLWCIFDIVLTVMAPIWMISFKFNSLVKIWYAHSFSNFSHFQLAIFQNDIAHFCNRFWSGGTSWLRTTWSSSELSHLNLNLLVHLATIKYEREEFPSLFWKSAWISFAFIPFFFPPEYFISVLSISKNKYRNNRQVSTPQIFTQSTDTACAYSYSMTVIILESVCTSNDLFT